MRALKWTRSSDSNVQAYVGMDVHQKSTTFCVMDPSAEESSRTRTCTVATAAAAYEAVLRPLAGRCHVAFEVCPQAQWVARIVRPLAGRVCLANPSRMPWLFRDGRKNDRLDAQKLATLLYLDQLPLVHLPSEDVSAWRAMINHRRGLISRRTRAKNQVRSILRSFMRLCPQRSCWTRVGMVWLREQRFDALRDVMMQGLLSELRFLAEQLKQVEGELALVAREHAGVALLQTIPGIGPRTAEAILAFTDDVQRFADRKKFVSYFGVVPTEDSSGQVVRRGRISKRGPSVVRWVLIEAARVAIRRCPELKAFYDRVCKGRKDRRKKAVVATGRKLLAIAFGMLRRGEVFDAGRLAPPPAQPAPPRPAA